MLRPYREATPCTGASSGARVKVEMPCCLEVIVSTIKLHRSSQELARLGPEAFSRHVRPRLLPEDDGKFAAVDVETGDYELDEDDFEAVTRLRSRLPSADVWLERIGQPTAYQMRRDG